MVLFSDNLHDLCNIPIREACGSRFEEECFAGIVEPCINGLNLISFFLIAPVHFKALLNGFIVPQLLFHLSKLATHQVPYLCY
jgi:hypothetical protein